jgi:hypothetical protein
MAAHINAGTLHLVQTGPSRNKRFEWAAANQRSYKDAPADRRSSCMPLLGTLNGIFTQLPLVER